MPSSGWSAYDLVYLRKLRIEASAYPDPLPRFSVETLGDGRSGMYDRHTRRLWLFLPEHFADPRASAEDVAQQMNEYENEHRTE